MQIAALLADLQSLSICSQEDALNLVSVHKRCQSDDEHAVSARQEDTALPSEPHNLQADNAEPEKGRQSRPSLGLKRESDPDVQRASDLIFLHYNVKVKYVEHGLDSDLIQARKHVNAVLDDLGKPSLT